MPVNSSIYRKQSALDKTELAMLVFALVVARPVTFVI